MIIRMKKINLEGPRADLRPVIEALKSTGAFELMNYKNANKEPVEEVATERGSILSNLRGRIKTALEFLSQPINISPEITYSELKKAAEQESIIIETIEKIEALKNRQHELKTETENSLATIRELSPYLKLDIAFNALRDTRNAFVLAGLIRTEQFEKYKSDYYLDNFILTEYPADGGRVCVICIGLKEDEPIIRSVYDYGFERCKFNFSVNAEQKIKELQSNAAELRNESAEIMRKMSLDKEKIELLKIYYDYLSSELDTENILNSALQTENSFLISGWIIESAHENIVQILQSVSRYIRIKISDAKNFDNPPVLVRNPKIIKPYQSITNLYGEPGLRDIDPNYFVAFFYFLFFGLMVGDIGYGILMSVAALIVLLVFKPKRGSKDLVAIICMGGISAIIWGIFFGSFFGADTSSGVFRAIFPAAIINPIEDALIFLVLALGLGVVHIVSGLMLKFYNMLRLGRVADAICDAFFRIVLFIGLVIFALSMLIPEFAGIATAGIIIAGASVVLIVATAGRKNKGVFGKISGGFGGLYSLVNYASDILSYARLFGLGLVGAVIAMVANTMGGMLISSIPIVGVPLGIIVAAFFHIFNLAIGLLSAYVHNARLQFIEFFGKFYEGGGRSFVPLGSNLKYVIIKPVLQGNKEGKYGW